MRNWLRSHLTYANVMATLAVFLVLGGGSAVALSGSNTVFTDDITDDTVPASGGNPAGGLVAADLRPNSVGSSEVGANAVNGTDVLNNSIASADITNGTVSVLDTNKVIPSGATVSGAFNELEDVGGSDTSLDLLFSADFHGLRAPTLLTDADINFDDIGISAAAAAADEESSGCTGGLATPTAPPGKVCIYLAHEFVIDGTAGGVPMGTGGPPFTEPDDKGFVVTANGTSTQAVLAGVWAYTAP